MRSQIIIALLLAVSGCRNSNPVAPIKEQPPTLTVEEANCTEVWLKISVPSSNNGIVTLKRDTTVIDTIRLTTADTTIVDANVLPSHTYTYTLAMAGVKSVTAQARTMDTTSHNINWTTYTLGDGTTSELFDVAIINDTLAYAVGNIYSGGTTYNVAKWNGRTWSFNQILYPYQGQQYFSELHSVFAFSDSDIWVGSNQPMHWNGTSWQTFDLSASIWNGWIYKIWGSSSSDLYIVGGSGSVAQYNGSTWTQISSGTSLPIKDIYGAQNANTGNLEIYATAGNPIESNDRALLCISGLSAQTISGNGITWPYNSMWFETGKYYWVAGSGVWEKHPTIAAPLWSSQNVTSYLCESIRGNDINDVFICGDYGELLHYSGASWKSYISQTYLNNGILSSIAVRGNLVMAVGINNSLGVAIVGRR